MKSMSRLLLSLAAVAACATANAAPFDSADQARRDRNRQEVMAKHGLSSSSSYRAESPPLAEEKKTIQTETKRAVVATKNFGHRSADRMREFGARANAKFKGEAGPVKDPYNHAQ